MYITIHIEDSGISNDYCEFEYTDNTKGIINVFDDILNRLELEKEDLKRLEINRF